LVAGGAFRFAFPVVGDDPDAVGIKGTVERIKRGEAVVGGSLAGEQKGGAPGWKLRQVGHGLGFPLGSQTFRRGQALPFGRKAIPLRHGFPRLVAETHDKEIHAVLGFNFTNPAR